MDEFFEPYDFSEMNMPWWEEAPQTAFHRYTNLLPSQPNRHACIPNVHKRMLGFLRMNQASTSTIVEQKPQRRNLKHIMAERMRRKKHSQIYQALHELLPLGTKSDKMSVQEMAGKEIKRLQLWREELRKRNGEMEMILENVEKVQLNLKVEFPASGVDSMLEVLRCFKNGGFTVSSIQSSFSHHEFSATLEFETGVGAASEVKKAVQRTLFEVEMKFRQQL